MKQNRFFLYIIALIIAYSLYLYPLTYTISTSNNVFYKSLSVTKTNTFVLNNRVNMPTYNYNLFLDFDRNTTDKIGNYDVILSPDIKYTDGVNGGYSILFPQRDSKIIINKSTSNSTIDKNKNVEGSFTIEFYLKPYKDNIDATIVNSAHIYKEGNEFKTIVINASVIGGRVVWSFENFFRYGYDILNVLMDKGSYIKTGEWSYHSISFDASTGKLVKYLNGMEEEVIYVTTTLDKNGGVYVSSLLKTINLSLDLGGGFVGAIDKFNILSDYKRKYDLNKYNDSGELVSSVIDLKDNTAYLETINIDEKNLNGTDIRLYYRVSDKYFLADDNQIEWNYIVNNFDLRYKKAKYIQVKALFSSDATKKYTPIMKSINIVYGIPIKPDIPSNFRVVPSNGAVTLYWNDSHNQDIAGYKIYYSTKPGVYNKFADVPIIISKNNSYRLENLDNETLYYFKIKSFSSFDKDNESHFSEEIFSRPKITLE